MSDGKLQTELLEPLPLGPLPARPGVSILMSNRNYGSYLGEAIESCLRQSYDNFELIICDDGSTDESSKILKRYELLDPRIKAIFQTHEGQAAALNAAFRVSRGEILCLLDSDDTFSPTKLKLVVEAFRAAPGSGLAANRMRRVSRDRRYLGQIPALYQLPSGWHGPSLLRSGPRMLSGLVPTSGLSLRRAAAEAVFPLPLRLKTCADLSVLYLAPLLTPIVSIEDLLGEYRTHGNNAQAGERFTPDRVRELVEFEKEIWRVWRRHLASFSCNFPIPAPEVPTLFAYAYERFRSNPKHKIIYEAIPRDFWRALPLAYQWYWRASVFLPDWFFTKSFNFIYGQTSTKMLVGRVFHSLRSSLSP